MKRTAFPNRRSAASCVAVGLLVAAVSPGAKAGEELSAKAPVIDDEEPKEYWVTPTADIRIRYEYGDQEGLRDSNAGTARARLGLKTKKYLGFQLFTEYEGTFAVDRDSYRAASVHGPTDRTIIADPESHELNQLWLSYDVPEGLAVIKAGRQAINLDNQRYVGGVAWRQNMQTFDAAGISVKPLEDLTIYYGYVWKANRIFGSDVEFAPQTDFEGNTHLVNVAYEGLPVGKLVAYAYLMDLGNEAGEINSNQSFGAYLTGPIFDTEATYWAEYAYQTDAFDSPLDYGTSYAHVNVSYPFLESFTGTIGVEYLGSDNGVGYKFPLGTNHKFNGFADRFLATPPGGLLDAYIGLGVKLPYGFSAALAYHHFWDADAEVSFGDEIDAVLKKDLGKGFSTLAKFAYFSGSGGFPDTTRFSIELNYKF